MNDAPRPHGRPFTLTDCPLRLGVLAGAAGGAAWGYMRFGLLGGVVGIPAGAILGVLCVVAALVVVALAALAVLSAWAFLRRGPRGVVLLFRDGPDAPSNGDPPANPDQPNERGG